jgi:hypothetical protein
MTAMATGIPMVTGARYAIEATAGPIPPVVETAVAMTIVRQAIEAAVTPVTGKTGPVRLPRNGTPLHSEPGTPGHAPIRSDAERERRRI